MRHNENNIKTLREAAKTTEAYKLIFGGYQVFYGWQEWPSYSYTTFGRNETWDGLNY